MCGIVGKLNKQPGHHVSRAEVDAMLAPIVHRGPDGSGVHLDREVGLGHRRLSIIDVEAGRQPMTNEDGSVWIVFNGEIYNFPELRAELLAKGHVFQTHCDTEVIVHLYEELGTGCVERLRGMFAFAIWDHKRKRLFVARDRVGIKPLYFSDTPQALFFASELKSILADPAVSRDVDLQALRHFFSFYYLPGQATLLRSVRRLLPGHFMVVENDRTTITRYWDLEFTDRRHGMSYDAVVEELYSLLGSTVRDHMIADVPVGVLLSGGVDSSAVLSFAVQGTDKPVSTFTVGFDGTSVVDERPYARLAAQRFGTSHHETTITAEDFWDFLPRYVWHMEDPVCEPPAIALHYVSQLARKHVKVLLSGEGGDEAFAGYPNYPNALALQAVSRAVGFAAPAVRGISRWAGEALDAPRLLRYGSTVGAPVHDHYFSRTSNPASPFNRHASSFFSPGFIAATSQQPPATVVAELLRGCPAPGLLSKLLYTDTKTWLPDDLLIKADKITMASSLELRVPLLDHQVLEFAASLPDSYKLAGRQTKRALKSAFARVVPQEILTRKKAGFPVPYDAWLSGPLASRARDLLATGQLKHHGVLHPRFSPRTDAQIFQQPKELFSLMVVELWLQQFAGQRAIPAAA